MKLIQISMILAICRGILCANDSLTARSETTSSQPEASSSFDSACIQSNNGPDSRLSGKVLRISGCVDVLPAATNSGRQRKGGSVPDMHRPTSVYVVAVHDDNTICTGSLELQRQEQPQGRFTFDVSLADSYFSWPVFIDVCRDIDFDNCRLIKVLSPEGTREELRKSVSGEEVHQRRHLKASRVLTSSSENETSAVLYQVYVDLCNATTSTHHGNGDLKNNNKMAAKMPTSSLMYRKLSKTQPKIVQRRAKRQTIVNSDMSAAAGGATEYNADGQMTGGPSTDWVRRIPAQFANNRRGPFDIDQSLKSYSAAAAAAPATVVRRKWKNGAAMQWIRKKSSGAFASADDVDNAVSGENGIIDEDYPDEQKRKWAKNGMGWIKRKWNKPGMGWLKRGGEEEKRKWKSNAGMKWV